VIGRVVRRLSRALERFNDSFAGTAAASGAVNSGQRGANADAVVGVLGEMKKRQPNEDSKS
jgi:hypothetical protein